MQTFLQLVAQDIQKIGNDLSRVAIVFPNKRASLFLQRAFGGTKVTALWSPALTSASVNCSDSFLHGSWVTPSAWFVSSIKVFREETQ